MPETTGKWTSCLGCETDSRDWTDHMCGGWLVSHLHELELAYREQATLDELRLAGLL